MENIFGSIGRVLFYLCLMGIGIATWLILERFSVIPAMCVIDQGAYNVVKQVMEQEKGK